MKFFVVNVSLTGVIMCTLLALVINNLQVAHADDFTDNVIEWEKEGVDPNHTESVNNVLTYIDDHYISDSFASMYIDRTDDDFGVLVFSFINPIDDTHKKKMEQLVMEPTNILFRDVSYTEQALSEKQGEIDAAWRWFEESGISLYHTGVNIIDDHVEIGISPYTSETAQLIYDEFGEDMVHVVEGQKVDLLVNESSLSVENDHVNRANEVKDHRSIFEDVVHFFRQLFN
ncbi:hypothetical protein MM221_05860 [Salipaludibacillus sp. LMS25]|jgi:hypothetical protein|uniref:hypothetical protein n=1 Tax=Salipaludibacillus sp. LMS25 TaxID=2924031 RepID=UPI0020D1D271|nr:hypothetical protein [Salipaludibacillus sp. LMS25]UTR16086.1 hypothetical protein MM221_05860 [Salipaludibacillus sp. LMS25]